MIPAKGLRVDEPAGVLRREGNPYIPPPVLAAREAVEELPEARVKPLISIEEVMDDLAKRVQSALNLSFREFAGGAKEKVEVIVSFLALLELVKQGAVAAEQYEQHGDIRISHTASASVPRYG